MVSSTCSAHRVSWKKALAWRMMRHHLHQRASSSDLVRVVADICGVHAQVTSSAELSLWARIEGLDRSSVQNALWIHRTLVKLWAARGTLYLLPAADLGVWLSALRTQTKFGNSGNANIDKLAEAVGRALEDRILTRRELALEVEAITSSPEFGDFVRFSWGSYLKAASFRGLICFAPSDGNLVRFTAPATWVSGKIAELEPTDALREITRYFLGAYAPATAEDVTRWWVGPPTAKQGARMLDLLGEETVAVNVGGRQAWVLAKDVDEMAAAKLPNVARLLPAFDPWVIGAPRQIPALMDDQYESRVFRKQGWISPVVLVNGKFAGVWRHDRTGRRLAIEIDPFDRVPAWARTQLEAEAERLAVFLECDLQRLRGLAH